MTRYIVDSYAWVEYLEGSPMGAAVERFLEAAQASWTPTPVVAEVTSKAIRTGKDPAVAWQVMRSWSQVLPLDADAARAAGALHAQQRKRMRDFAMTDAIVLAFARRLDATVLTGDPHFRGMRGVQFLG